MSKKSSKKANKALTQAVATNAEVATTEAVVNDNVMSADDLAAIDALFATEDQDTEVAFVLEPTDEALPLTTGEAEAIATRVKPEKAKKAKAEKAVVVPQAPVQIITALGEMGELMKNVDQIDATAMVMTINGEIDTRAKFENEKSPDNANIHKTIKKIRGSLGRNHAATLMLAANVSPTFINRTLQDGSKYNVYAILKVADLVDGLTGAGLRNSINIACMRSLFNFHKAGMIFTGELAKAAASDKIRVSEAVKKHLVRHTVSASTAPTQASSTMQALQTLGVVKIEGSRKHPSYTVIDSPTTRRLMELAEGFDGSAMLDEEAEAA